MDLAIEFLQLKLEVLIDADVLYHFSVFGEVFHARGLWLGGVRRDQGLHVYKRARVLIDPLELRWRPGNVELLFGLDGFGGPIDALGQGEEVLVWTMHRLHINMVNLVV